MSIVATGSASGALRRDEDSNSGNANGGGAVDESTRWNTVKQATLKRLKESRSPFAKISASERFFILKETSLDRSLAARCAECQAEATAVRAYEAGLECRTRFALDEYESEKKYRKLGFGGCRRSVDLLCLFHVKRCAYAKFKLCLSLYTGNTSVHLAFANEEQLNDWYDSLIEVHTQLALDAQQSSAPYSIECTVCKRHTDYWASIQNKLLHFDLVGVWEVTTKNKDLGQNRRELAGRWRLALTENEVMLIRCSEQAVSWTFQIPCIRSCTHYLDNTFSLDLGRAAPTGEGRLYFDMFDEQDAKNVHDSLFGKMNSCSQRAGLDSRTTANVAGRRRRKPPTSQPQQLPTSVEQSETAGDANARANSNPSHAGRSQRPVSESRPDTPVSLASSKVNARRSSKDTQTASEMSTPLAGARSIFKSKRPSQKSCGALSGLSISNASSSALSALGTSKISLVSARAVPIADADRDRPVEFRAHFISLAENRVSLDVPSASGYQAGADASVSIAVGDTFRKRSISDSTKTKQQPLQTLDANQVKRPQRHGTVARPISGNAAILDESLPLASVRGSVTNASTGSSPSVASAVQTSGSRRNSNVLESIAPAVVPFKSQQSVASVASQQTAATSRRGSGASRHTLGVGGNTNQIDCRRNGGNVQQAHLTPSHSGHSSGYDNLRETSAASSDTTAGCDYLQMSPAHTTAASISRSATGDTRSRSPLPINNQSGAVPPYPLSQSSLATSNQLISNGSLADRSLSDALSSASPSACSPVIGVSPLTITQRRYTTGDASSLFLDRGTRFRHVRPVERDQAARNAPLHLQPPVASQRATATQRGEVQPTTDSATLCVPGEVDPSDAAYDRLKARSHSVGSASFLRVRPVHLLPVNYNQLAQRHAAAAKITDSGSIENDRSSSSLSSAYASQSHSNTVPGRDAAKSNAATTTTATSTSTTAANASVASPVTGGYQQRGVHSNGSMRSAIASLFGGQKQRRDRASQRRFLPSTTSSLHSPTQTSSSRATSIETVAASSPSSASASIPNAGATASRTRRQHPPQAPQRSATLINPSAVIAASSAAASSAASNANANAAMIFNTNKQNELMEVSFSPRPGRARPHTTNCTFSEQAAEERLIEQDGEFDTSAESPVAVPTLVSFDCSMQQSSPNMNESRARSDSNPESAVHSIRPVSALVVEKRMGRVRKASGMRNSLRTTLRDMLRTHSSAKSGSASASGSDGRTMPPMSTSQEPTDAYVLFSKPDKTSAQPQPQSQSIHATDSDVDTYLPLGPAEFSRDRRSSRTSRGSFNDPQSQSQTHTPSQSQRGGRVEDRPSVSIIRPPDVNANVEHDYENIGVKSVAFDLKCSPNQIRALASLQPTLSVPGGSSPNSVSIPQRNQVSRDSVEPASASSGLQYATLDFSTPVQPNTRPQHRLSGGSPADGSTSTGGHRSLKAASSGGHLVPNVVGSVPVGRTASSSSSNSNSNSAEYAAPVFTTSPDRPLVPLKLSLSAVPRFANASANAPTVGSKTTPATIDDALYVDLDVRQGQTDT